MPSNLPAVESAEARDQIIHWLAEGLSFHRIEILCNEREWDVPSRRVLWSLRDHHKDEIETIRQSWLSRMYNEGLANKDQRLRFEVALASEMRRLTLEGGEDYSGRPKFQMRDLINLIELIRIETSGPDTKDDKRFQVLIQNIVGGVPEGEHATIEVGAESRLLPASGVQADGPEGAEGASEHVTQVSSGRRRGQREVRDHSEGTGAACPVPAGDEKREDS